MISAFRNFLKTLGLNPLYSDGFKMGCGEGKLGTEVALFCWLFG